MTHEENERLLTLLSEYLCFQPCGVSAETLSSLTADGLSLEDAYITALSALLGLDPDVPADWALQRGVLQRVIRRCMAEDYMQDAYLRRIGHVIGQIGQITLTQDEIAPLELFVLDDFEQLPDGSALPHLGWFETSFHFPAVKEDDRVWMTVTPNEINTIQPCVKASRGRVLTFGLGLGYYAFHCLLKSDVDSVTVVEQNPDIIELFRTMLLPHFPRPDALQIIQADAFDYAKMHLQAYDTVFTDLWHDVSDGLPLYQRMKALEVEDPKYLYWIEKTLKCYLPEESHE